VPRDRRRHRRKRVDLNGSYRHGASEERIQAHLSDMSLGGAFLETQGAILPFGRELTVSIELPSGRSIEVQATVRWTKPHGMGVQFGSLGARDTYELTEFLAEHEEIPDSRLLE
jgi:type IV pilus assembly protein PilZ